MTYVPLLLSWTHWKFHHSYDFTHLLIFSVLSWFRFIFFLVSTENLTQNLYHGNERGFLLQNTLFRVGKTDQRKFFWLSFFPSLTTPSSLFSAFLFLFLSLLLFFLHFYCFLTHLFPFAKGGAAIILSNKWTDAHRANFKLLHCVRTQYVR